MKSWLTGFATSAALLTSSTVIGLTSEEAEKLATDAYIYGYPLITMDLTREVMTNVEKPDGMRSPEGTFTNVRTYPPASFRDVTAPNADTLYSVAWLNVSKEPWVLHVPAEEGRYYLMPMLSGWTDVFADPGTRTTGSQAGDFAITGPSWKGTLPAGVKEIKSPTDMVWILGRTYSTGTPEDYAAVHKIQDQYSVKPLSYFGKDYEAPQGIVNSNLDMKTPVRDQVNQLEAEKFFDRLAKLLKSNPPSKEDAPMVAKLKQLGIVSGQPFDISQLDPEVADAVRRAPKLGQQRIEQNLKQGMKEVNGWSYPKYAGSYGTQYLDRATIAAFGLGANLPQDAIYPSTSVDDKGQTLNGSNQYVIHFAKGQLPPVKGFWSLTMYDSQFFFVENPLNRYTLSARNALKSNADGSIDLYIQNESPGADKESNWLPAPKGDFVLMLRMYWPEKAVIDGSWKPPVVQKQ